MADFAHLPPSKTKGVSRVIRDVGVNKAPYINVDKPPIKNETLAKPHHQPSSSELVGKSVLWPLYAAKAHLVTPFAVAAFSLGLVAPLLEPQIGVGAAVLFGYTAGGVVYGAQTSKIPITD